MSSIKDLLEQRALGEADAGASHEGIGKAGISYWEKMRKMTQGHCSEMGSLAAQRFGDQQSEAARKMQSMGKTLFDSFNFSAKAKSHANGFLGTQKPPGFLEEQGIDDQLKVISVRPPIKFPDWEDTAEGKEQKKQSDAMLEFLQVQKYQLDCMQKLVDNNKAMRDEIVAQRPSLWSRVMRYGGSVAAMLTLVIVVHSTYGASLGAVWDTLKNAALAFFQ